MPSGSENLRGNALQTDIRSSFPVLDGFPTELTLIEPDSQETKINYEAALAFGAVMRRNQDSPIPTVFWTTPSAIGLVVSWPRWEKLKKKLKNPEYGVNLGANSITASFKEGELTAKAEAVFQITGRNNLGILFIGSNTPEELMPVLNYLTRAASEAGKK